MDGSSHHTEEAGVGERFVFKDDQERGQKIAHALGVAVLRMCPYVCGYNVA